MMDVPAYDMPGMESAPVADMLDAEHEAVLAQARDALAASCLRPGDMAHGWREYCAEHGPMMPTQYVAVLESLNAAIWQDTVIALAYRAQRLREDDLAEARCRLWQPGEEAST